MENNKNLSQKRKLRSSSKATVSKKLRLVDDSDNLSLLILNDDCLLHVFGYLDLMDVLNTSEVCERLEKVATDHYKRVKFFKWKGLGDTPNHLAKKIFPKIGRYLVELVIYGLYSDQNNYSDFIAAVRNNCTNLKCVKFLSCLVDRLWIDCLASYHSLERVTFQSSICSYNSFPVMRELKEFNLQNCYHLNENMLKSVLNNAHIENLTLEYQRSPISPNFDLAPIIKMSSLKSICLYIYQDTVHQLDSLLQLNGLLKLKITAKNEKLNVDEFFAKMAEKGTLKELEISNLRIGKKTFVALSAMKLKLLNIDGPEIIDSQMNLKSICRTLSNMTSLENLTLSIYDRDFDMLFMEDILLLIEQLRLLELLNIYHLDCVYGSPDCESDIPTLIKNINDVLIKCYRPKLKLILPWSIMAEFFGDDGHMKRAVRTDTTFANIAN